MFTGIALNGVYEDCRAVKSTSFALNNANYQKDVGLLAYGFHARDSFRVWNLNSSRMVPQELVSTLGGAVSHHYTKEAVFRVSTYATLM